MIKLNQEVAERNPMPGMGLRFSQVIAGWGGAGFDSSFREISGSYLEKHNPPMAQISFSVVDTIGKRGMRRDGSICLKPADALAFAAVIAPQLVVALELAKVALEQSEAKGRVYIEPVERHNAALKAVNEALAFRA